MLSTSARERRMSPDILVTHIATVASAYESQDSGDQLVGIQTFARRSFSNDLSNTQLPVRNALLPETRIIKNTAANVTIDGTGSSTAAFDRALARLRRFRSWEENWDGEGASAPNPTVLDTAIQLLSSLARGHAVFNVGLDAEARPMFNLRDSRFDGYIVVEPETTLSFSFEHENGTTLDGFALPFDGKKLPETLADALSQI